MNQQQRIEFFACLALKHTPGLGLCGLQPILNAHPSAKDALDNARSWSARKLASHSCGRAAMSEAWRDKAEAEYKSVLQAGMKVLLWSDPEYPARLRHIHTPPLFLYYEGDLSLLGNPAITVVGSRNGSPEARQDTLDLCARLSRYGITVVSGMALGIDRQAHLGGLSGIGGSIGLLAAGLDVDYPSRNRDLRASMEHRGLLLTEFPPEEPARGKHFPQRNRIMSGLSLGVAVMDAGEKSGSLITAREGLEQGREIFARPGFPHDPGFAGCESLLNDGAHPVRSAEDMLMVLGDLLKQELPEDLSRTLAEDMRTRKPTPRTAPARKQAASNTAASTPVPSTISHGRHTDSGTEPPASPSPPPATAERPPMSEPEAALFNALPETGHIHLDDLARLAGLDAPAASATLIMMEINGLVRQLPGMRYSRR